MLGAESIAPARYDTLNEFCDTEPIETEVKSGLLIVVVPEIFSVSEDPEVYERLEEDTV